MITKNQKIAEIAKALALMDGLVNPPEGGKYYRYAEQALTTIEWLDSL